MTTQQNAKTTISESAKEAIDSANAAWKDSSLYITIPVGEETILKFHPDMKDGIIVKQDTFQGQPSGYKTFYQVVDVNSTNDGLRIFKANRKSSKLINDELGKGHWLLRIKRVGDGMNTLYQPIPSAK